MNVLTAVKSVSACVAITASSFLSACCKEKPIPTTADILRTPDAQKLLVDRRVMLDASTQFIQSVSNTYTVDPGPIIMQCGDSTLILPQAPYQVTDIYFSHNVTLANTDPNLTYSVLLNSQVQDGPCKIVVTFCGLSEKGEIILKDFEVLPVEYKH